MLHEHVINFLEAAVVFLMLTNAVSISAAAYAMALLVAHGRTGSRGATLPLPAPLARWLHPSKPAP
jgi:hypothetical protein